MSTDIIPAGESGRFEISKVELVNMDVMTLAAAEALIRAEAERRNLDLTVTENIATGGLVAEWRPAVRGGTP